MSHALGTTRLGCAEDSLVYFHVHPKARRSHYEEMSEDENGPIAEEPGATGFYEEEAYEADEGEDENVVQVLGPNSSRFTFEL